VAERFVLLDGLRGLAAFAVVIHHVTSASGHRELFASGALAVDFFFCLSGFVIASAYGARLRAGMTAAKFARNRLIRLYPMHMVGIILGSIALLVLHGRGATDATAGSIATATAFNLAYLPYLNHYSIRLLEITHVGLLFPLNSPAWSLFFEGVANIAFVFAVAFSTRATVAWTVAWGVLLCAWMLSIGEAPGWGYANIAGGLPRVMFSFFAGVLLFTTHERWRVLSFLGPFATAALVAAVLAVPRFDGHHLYWLVSVLVLIPLLVAAGSWARIEPGSLTHRACDYAGRMSYPLYCIHYPILMAIAALAPTLSYPVMLGLFMGGSLLASHLVLVHFDEPLRAWLSARAKRA
jgi:peptidoglycan/LPS O-acetylase OafA/YrhL